jgi:hypothetical protein
MSMSMSMSPPLYHLPHLFFITSSLPSLSSPYPHPYPLIHFLSSASSCPSSLMSFPSSSLSIFHVVNLPPMPLSLHHLSRSFFFLTILSSLYCTLVFSPHLFSLMPIHPSYPLSLFTYTVYIPLNPQPSPVILFSSSLFLNASSTIPFPLSLTHNFPLAFRSYILLNPLPSPLIISVHLSSQSLYPVILVSSSLFP